MPRTNILILYFQYVKIGLTNLWMNQFFVQNKMSLGRLIVTKYLFILCIFFLSLQ